MWSPSKMPSGKRHEGNYNKESSHGNTEARKRLVAQKVTKRTESRLWKMEIASEEKKHSVGEYFSVFSASVFQCFSIIILQDSLRSQQ